LSRVSIRNIGLLHRGTEKTDRAEDLRQAIPYFDRPRLRRADETGARFSLAAEKLARHYGAARGH